jgi:hypothetical protein
MKWLERLANPFVLVVEGFVVGAILFAASTPSPVDSRPAPPPAALDSTIIPNPTR